MKSYYDKEQERIIKQIKDEYKSCGFDSDADFLWIYVMQGCGCGNREQFQEDAYNLFIAIGQKKATFELIYKDLYTELLAQMLDSRGLLEHGSSIGGAWLSEAGEVLFSLFNNNV